MAHAERDDAKFDRCRGATRPVVRLVVRHQRGDIAHHENLARIDIEDLRGIKIGSTFERQRIELELPLADRRDQSLLIAVGPSVLDTRSTSSQTRARSSGSPAMRTAGSLSSSTMVTTERE